MQEVAHLELGDGPHADGDGRSERHRHHGQQRRGDPDPAVAVRPDGLTEDGPQPEAAVDRHRPVADRLTTTLGRGEFVDGRGGTDEHSGFADAADGPQDDEQRQGVGQRIQQERRTGEGGAADDEQLRPFAITEGTDEGSDQRGDDVEDADRHPDAELRAPELVLDVARDHRDQHGHGHEVGQPCSGDADEQGGDQRGPGLRLLAADIELLRGGTREGSRGGPEGRAGDRLPLTS